MKIAISQTNSHIPVQTWAAVCSGSAFVSERTFYGRQNKQKFPRAAWLNETGSFQANVFLRQNSVAPHII